jgi:uncharacterized protein (DUF849 family)
MNARPAVISVAPTGARRGKSDHPALPITPAEIAEDAVACAAAGASVLHLHVRDGQDQHSLDVGRYRDAIASVRAATGDDLIVQVTTEAVGRYTRHEQMALVRELRPQAVSLAVRELVSDDAAADEAIDFFAWAHEAGIGLQFIVYDADDTRRLIEVRLKAEATNDRAVASGFSRKAPHALFVLGRYSTAQRALPRDLLPFLEQWPQEWPWTACAFGPHEAACLADALTLGGHVRVGFENNLLRPDGTPSSGNAEQVAYVRDLALRAHRRPATAAEARAIYGLTS